jgi:iron complex transport system ATP-binding protein
MSSLEATTVSVATGRRTILSDLSLGVHGGEVLGLLGPNGAGKSTLLRVMTRVLAPTAGSVALDGQDVEQIPPSQLARRIGYLPQGAACHWSLAVEQVVALGRLPHRRPFSAMSHGDWECVERAMDDADVAQFRGRPVDKLSTGERARVLLARALAGEPDILLVDEPVAGLDPAHQLEVMTLLERLAEGGAAVLVVLHDLTLAARHCARLALLDNGRLVASGDAQVVLSEDNLRDCFGIRAHRGHSAEGPFVIPVQRLPGRDQPTSAR